MFENILCQLYLFAVQAPAAPVAPASVPVPIVTSTVQEIARETVASPLSGFLTGLLMTIYGLVCLALILLVMFQNSKQDNLAGLMGGGMQSVFRGKQSTEQKFSALTSWVAATFIVSSIGIYFWIINVPK